MLLAPRRLLAPIAVLTIAVAEGAKYYYLHADPTGMGYYVATVSCADEFAGGALVALAARASALPSLVRGWLHPATTAVTLAGIVTGPWWSAVLPPQLGYANFVLYDVVATTAVAGMLWGAMRGYRGRLGAALGCRPAARVAAVSYGLYVYHPLVPPLVAAALVAAGGPGANLTILRAPIALALSVGLSMLSWAWFEQPINELKKHF
jgi:peptidoglycan/LPS O-acetylase OafA/YrhL